MILIVILNLFYLYGKGRTVGNVLENKLDLVAIVVNDD